MMRSVGMASVSSSPASLIGRVSTISARRFLCATYIRQQQKSQHHTHNCPHSTSSQSTSLPYRLSFTCRKPVTHSIPANALATGVRHFSAAASNPDTDAAAQLTKRYGALLQDLLTINQERKIRMGIETTRRLLERLGPKYDLTQCKPAIPTIHVAGSNGKGSTAMKIARTLQLHGLNVGLYTSPHISSFRERIEINGDPMSEEDVCELLPPIIDLVKNDPEVPATFFELGTALAFGTFIHNNVDVAVIEVGLGGRLDSTNVITPELSIITSISLEHTAWLGDTIEAIAREKAGIIKPGVPVLIGPHVPRSVVEQVATEKKAGALMQIETRFGDYDAENSECSRRALEILTSSSKSIKSLLARHGHAHLDPALVERGLKSLPHCRFERVRYAAPGPGYYIKDEKHRIPALPVADNTWDVILDVCHNPDAFMRLFEKLKQEGLMDASRYAAASAAAEEESKQTATATKRRPLYAVVGFSSDKDFSVCLETMMQYCDRIFIVSADTPRAATVDAVMKVIDQKGLKHRFPQCSVTTLSSSPYTTVSRVLAVHPYATEILSDTNHSPSPPVLLCCGTFFLMSDVRRALQLPHPVDPIATNEQSMKKV